MLSSLARQENPLQVRLTYFITFIYSTLLGRLCSFGFLNAFKLYKSKPTKHGYAWKRNILGGANSLSTLNTYPFTQKWSIGLSIRILNGCNSWKKSECATSITCKKLNHCDIQGQPDWFNLKSWIILTTHIYVVFTDRLSFHTGWTAHPNPSFPCRMSANSQQKSSSPNLEGRYCYRNAQESASVIRCGFFGETWLDPKVYWFRSSVFQMLDKVCSFHL